MAVTFRYRSRTHPYWWVFVLGIILIVAALLTWQQRYIRQQKPIITAAVAAANKEGDGIFEKLGVPPESKPNGELEKNVLTGGPRGMWQNFPMGAEWKREYEMPGDFETIAAWYRKQLQRNGWSSYDDMPISIVQREYKKGKWIVKIGQHAWFQYPPHTRVSVELSWYYSRSEDNALPWFAR
jgi:hypothetical protein